MSDPSPFPKLHPARVARALVKLPHSEREALLLKAREGRSYAEIGALLGLSAAAAEAKVAAALVTLRAELDRPRPLKRLLAFWRCLTGLSRS
jgi:DNA-directed RNA polymerase specialized sigma24 family protein